MKAPVVSAGTGRPLVAPRTSAGLHLTRMRLASAALPPSPMETFPDLRRPMTLNVRKNSRVDSSAAYSDVMGSATIILLSRARARAGARRACESAPVRGGSPITSRASNRAAEVINRSARLA
jgi:hypothetical protein